MLNILFFGNCQSYAVLKTLNLPFDKYKIEHIECWTTNIQKNEILEIIKRMDIIITQPVKDNYRNIDYLNTSFIIENMKKNCKMIIFDSCYFDFYYVDLKYLFIKSELLRVPIDYHFDKMLTYYKNKKSKTEYIEEIINNENLYSYEENENRAIRSLNELKKRYDDNKLLYEKENIYFISTHDYIKNNYKDILLFYSMNHPTKYLIQYICEEIVKILGINNTINKNICMLGDAKCILYKCIQKNVNFNIEEHKPLIKKKIDIDEIVDLYYKTYDGVKFE